MSIPRKLIIAIDGPAGSGKSTVSRIVAERLGYCYVDTGAMYRAIGWKALHLNISLQDVEAVTDLARQAKLELTCDPRQFRISVDGTDVTTAIRTPEISDASSKVSAIAAVRRELVAQQQRIGKPGGVVMEGRDIGTVVFPKADLKIFLDASPEARGDRRHAQDIVEGKVVDRDQTVEEVRRRDQRDSTRAASPMVAAPDAVHLDTTHLSVDEVVEKILGLFERVQGGRSSRSL